MDIPRGRSHVRVTLTEYADMIEAAFRANPFNRERCVEMVDDYAVKVIGVHEL